MTSRNYILILLFSLLLLLPTVGFAQYDLDPDDHKVYQERIRALAREVDLRFIALEKSVTLARQELERRLEGMNEFRNQLNRQAATFATKQELNLIVRRLEDKIDYNKTVLDKSTGSKQWSDHIITVLIGMGVITAVVLIRRNGVTEVKREAKKGN